VLLLNGILFYSVFALIPLDTGRVLINCRRALYCKFLLLNDMDDSRAINFLLTYLLQTEPGPKPK